MCLVLFWLKCLVTLDFRLFYVILRFSTHLSMNYTKDCGAVVKVNQWLFVKEWQLLELVNKLRTVLSCVTILHVNISALGNYLCRSLLDLIIPGLLTILAFPESGITLHAEERNCLILSKNVDLLNLFLSTFLFRFKNKNNQTQRFKIL